MSRRASSSRCFGSEPAFAPIRIGIPARFAAFTTCSVLSAPPMFPGLMRTAATPASIASSASEALKWMSAITGIGESRTISGSAFASSRFGTATRTSSQPADASAAIWAVVAATSWVLVRVIDWTTTGAPPPISTPPTLIRCALAIGVRVAALRAGYSRQARRHVRCRRAPCPRASGRPPPSRWRLEAPPADHPDDLWAIGADLEPATLLGAYRLGLFPMPVGPETGWFSPARRGIVPLDPFAPSRSLRRASRGFAVRVDTAFRAVVEGCARPGEPSSWIDSDIVGAYLRLHELGWAHSVEAWDEGGLAGGLYGVAIGGLFAAESMFHARTGASKATFVALVELLRAAGDADRRLLDVQWLTPHLASLGAVEVSRAEYRERLAAALELSAAF